MHVWLLYGTRRRNSRAPSLVPGPSSLIDSRWILLYGAADFTDQRNVIEAAKLAVRPSATYLFLLDSRSHCSIAEIRWPI